MCPQFVDFDGDGYTDIITATYEGTPFIVRGSAEGWRQPEHLEDSQGRNIVLGFFYNMETNRYETVDRSPEGKKNKEDHCVSAAAFDWDADGDFDLLLGAYDGNLYLQRNEGAPGEPKFTGVNELLEAGGKDFNVSGGLTAARPVDWDGDGLTDLICGGFKGGVYVYRNTGGPGKPKFDAPVTLIAKSEEVAQGAPAGPTSGLYVDPTDYDGDGDLDLLVGGYADWQPRPRELTDAEQARIKEINAEIEEIQASLMKFYEEVQKQAEGASSQDEIQAIYDRMSENEAFQEKNRASQELWEELSTLQPMQQREAGVWLYRRK